MTDAQYQHLREAIRAYARALAAYGLMVGPDGSNQWVDSDRLDELWSAVLEAADLDPDELKGKAGS